MNKELEKIQDKLALDFSGFDSKEEWNGLNLIARDQFVGFKRGFNAAVSELEQHPKYLESVKELIEALKFYANTDEDDGGHIAREALEHFNKGNPPDAG